VPDPASRAFTPAQEAAWYAQLPTMFGAAGALFTDDGGRVLLVKPNYRDYWSLPGGILEHGEPPHEACRREVLEELGLDITPGRLLVVGWTGLDGTRPRPVLHFVFDCGTLAAGTPIRLQAEELDDYRLVEIPDLDDYLPPPIGARVLAAVRGRDGAGTAYLPWLPAS
jgi:8-oxo-dGTP diphosphatase